jgi:hypothetical protein
MQMAVRIVLEAHNRAEFTLSKYFIQDVLVGSILAQALETDPEVKEIPIPNPVVTPKAMQVLVNLSRGFEPIVHDPELRPAAIYLNCERLMVYTYQAYDHNLTNYSEVGYNWAISQEALCVVKYRLEKGYRPSSQNLISAVRQNLPEVVRLLLPLDGMHWAYGIELVIWACEKGHLDILQTVWSNLVAFPYTSHNEPIRAAVEHNQLAVVKFILMDPQVDPSDNNNEALTTALRKGYTEIVECLQQHPKVKCKLLSA